MELLLKLMAAKSKYTGQATTSFLEVQKPEDKRPLDTRRPVSKSNFPKRQHPKHLQKADLVRVFETNQDWSEAQTVAKNDCFKGEMRRFVFCRFI